MLIVPLGERLQSIGPKAVLAWERAVSQAHAMDADRGGDPWLFHGTHLGAGRSVMREGFQCPVRITPLDRLHVYWGPLDYALNFADKAAMLRRPALLAARLSAILASGEPLPMTSDDRQCEGAPELPDWRASLAESGCLRVRRGCHVEGIVLLGEAAERIAA